MSMSTGAQRGPSMNPPVAEHRHPSGALTERSFFAGGDLVAATGLVPNTLLTGSPYVGWRAGRSWLDPSLRIAFLRTGSALIDVFGDSSASFTWTLGRLDACALALPGRIVRGAACARIEAGTLEGRGFGIAAPADRLRPWFAGGALLRAEWSLPSRFFVSADAGVLVRVTNERFIFLPNVRVNAVPVVGLSGGVGLGVDLQ
jgi:hypothetical protein